MVLNFDNIARYSVTTEYGSAFRSQSSIFGTQNNVERNFDRVRYLVPTDYGAE